jgi:L-ascorbate metabolism protein UlaG (beta-lactamase superfamily)
VGRNDWEWDYPPVEGVEADVVLVTHDHLDHNAVEAIGGDPVVLPMHYRTPAIGFLEPPDAFLDALGAQVERLESSEAEVEPLLGSREEPVVALPAPPV